MRRLLVIDDEQSLLKLLCEVLPKLQIEVVVAHSYDEAYQYLAEQTFHAIVSDLNLPQKSGLELLTHLRQDGSDIPFILMSGNRDPKSSIEALRLGAIDFIEKPFNLSYFLNAIESALQVGYRTRRIQQITKTSQATNPEMKKIEQEQKMIMLARTSHYKKM